MHFLTFSEALCLLGDNLSSRQSHVIYLQTRYTPPEHACIPWPLAHDRRIISSQAQSESPNISLRDRKSIHPKSRKSCPVVICGADVVPLVRFNTFTGQWLHFPARALPRHQPEVELVRACQPQMESPALGIEMQNGSGLFRVYPGDDCYGVAGVQTAIVWDQSIAPSSPSSTSPWEIVGSLWMSVGASNKRETNQPGCWILKLAAVTSA